MAKVIRGLTLALVLVALIGCASASFSDLAFDRAACIAYDLAVSRCEEIVNVAVTNAPDPGTIDGVGFFPDRPCFSGTCEVITTAFVAKVAFHYVDERPSRVVQVRELVGGTLSASLMPPEYGAWLGVP